MKYLIIVLSLIVLSGCSRNVYVTPEIPLVPKPQKMDLSLIQYNNSGEGICLTASQQKLFMSNMVKMEKYMLDQKAIISYYEDMIIKNNLNTPNDK